MLFKNDNQRAGRICWVLVAQIDGLWARGKIVINQIKDYIAQNGNNTNNTNDQKDFRKLFIHGVKDCTFRRAYNPY